MKRLRSYDDDLDSVGGGGGGSEKGGGSWGGGGRRREKKDLDRSLSSSSHRRFYDRKGLSSSFSNDRSVDDDREVSRSSRKQRIDQDSSEPFDRTTSRKNNFDRYRDNSDRGVPVSSSSPRNVYGGGGVGDRAQLHRSDSVSGSRRDYPKGIRSERDRSRREGSVSSRREESSVFSLRRSNVLNKDSDEDPNLSSDVSRGTTNNNQRAPSEDIVNVKSPKGSWRDVKSQQGPSKDVVVKIPQGLSRDVVVKSPQGSSRYDVKSPQGWSRDIAKSPQGWSRDAIKSPQGSSREVVVSPQGSSRDAVKSPQGSSRDVKSPPWSKESSCEQSKSGEVKKNDEVQRESGNCSEMEEGELEPEPEPDSEPIEKPQLIAENPVGDMREVEYKNKIDPDVEESKYLSKEKLEGNGEYGVDGKQETRGLVTLPDTVKENCKLPYSEDSSVDGISRSKEVDEEKAGDMEENARSRNECVSTTNVNPRPPGDEVESEGESAMKSLPSEELQKDGKGIDLEVKAEDVGLVDSRKEAAEQNRALDVTLMLTNDNKLTQNIKGKGKSLAVSPSSEANLNKNGPCMERDLLLSRDDAMEGPSSRGFELFFSPIVTRIEKTNSSGSGVNNQKVEKLKIEPLELCLGLPNVSLPLPLNSVDPIPTSSSPSHARSIQSFPTTLRSNSDAFTTSMSFSGSQTFVHNPSCSLRQNSFENNYEQSVGSHPLFQGVDQASHGTWPAQPSVDLKRKEVPLYQRILLNGNGSLQPPQTFQGVLNSQTSQVQHHKVSEGSNSGVPVRLDRQSSLSRQLSGLQSRHHDDVRSPSNSMGFQDTRSEYSNIKRLMIESSGSLIRSNSRREFEQQLVVGGTGFGEKIIAMIVSEPIQVMANRFQEMTEQSIAYLKKITYEMIMLEDKCGQLQKALQKRSDVTLETLLKSHRVQLEILVALKTGVRDFLQLSNNIPSSELADIFLNLKCRNPACRSLIPVDECDCKVCLQKNGFCSACMCLVCSKFDMASNTCSWVGCDGCLHWCHTDCGLRESFIRNGQIVTGAHGATEMQFHCVACDHPSEMFGFVKEVFKTCAKDWKAETFSKELEYVKRIFAASNDWRGRKLHDIASHMLPRLESKSSVSEIYNFIMGFFTAVSDSKLGNSSFSAKESPVIKPGEGSSNGGVGPVQEAKWLVASAGTEKVSPRVESAGKARPVLDWDHMVGNKHVEDRQKELLTNVDKKYVVDDLESIVRIKKAEAKMFQERADNAKREAEGLKRIAIAKSEKIEEEYRTRITKLRLVEAEERRKQKLEELQVMEREHREYLSMKMRMETDIKYLLMKMESTTGNLGS
ncbi:hypothetical protein MKX03_012858 [Papaver bracteatum]|nr:hypothetical protein MKX03_012858 [Papaver bracteatum]